MFNGPSITRVIDGDMITADEAYAVSNDMWLEVIKQDLIYYKTFVCFYGHLKMIAEKATGFFYEISSEIKGNVTGSVWQTVTTRDNFERLCGHLYIGKMKR